jgi:hypothetical protein
MNVISLAHDIHSDRSPHLDCVPALRDSDSHLNNGFRIAALLLGIEQVVTVFLFFVLMCRMISALHGHNKGLPIFICFDIKAWKVVPKEYAPIPLVREMFEDHRLSESLKLAFAAMFLHVDSPLFTDCVRVACGGAVALKTTALLPGGRKLLVMDMWLSFSFQKH